MPSRELLAMIRERCYQEGDFTLSSGDKSNYYFDGKKIALSSAGLSLIGEEIYNLTQELEFDAIGGLESGALPLATAAVYAYSLHGREMEGFFVRHEAKKHGTMKIIEGTLRPGSKVVVVDDVATKGTSILKAITEIRKAECEPILVLVLVDRLQGAEKLFREQRIPFRSVFTIKDVANMKPVRA